MQAVRPQSLAQITLLVAGLAWLTLFALMRGMMATDAAGSFMLLWIVMMAAMMLPSLAPLVSRYTQMFVTGRWAGMVQLVAGYLTVWAAAGILAYGTARGLAALTRAHAAWAARLAVGIYVVAGLYQFTSLKGRCLATCRVPLGQLLKYAGWKGSLRHLRVGLHHGLYCTACCWSLMLALFAFGLMNLGMMSLVALVVMVEQLWAEGPWFSWLVGIASLTLAFNVPQYPALAAGLAVPPMPTLMSMP
jgi:predicted metal-binding membrane protein